jgi:hypothetical protein
MRRISKLKLGLLAVVLALVAAPAARAFTLDKAGNTNSDGSAKYTDPDDRYGDQDKSGKGTFSFGGGTTLTVGPQRSFNNDFDSGKERMLSPLDRDR